ncbi:unnamed protein product [Rotaria socialis]|uniref:Tyrosine specific protein phosphatases domain-containing protein n=2 Tax=Rotaria socialis TaxID=392032 RepID=A0A818PI66_9BILA|nr:unnamed protein product [Rotaria socialis]CAF3623374.1 unnamed protein product [Rotaria socialis]
MAENDISIKRGGGFMGVFGPRIDSIAREVATAAGVTIVPSSPYHITLLTKDELRQLSTDSSNKIDRLNENAATIDTRNILSLGVGGHPNGVCWVVIIWNAGNIFRKKYGLPCKQFHITLSDHDDHTPDKSLHSLHTTLSIDTLDLNTLDHLVLYSNLSDQHDQAFIYAREMCIRFPDSEKSWLRLADITRRNEQCKLAMLAYARTMHHIDEQENEKIHDYCYKKILNCASMYTEWECLFGENELDQIPEELKMSLLTPWTQTMRQRFVNIYSDEQPQYQQLSREHLFVPFIDPRQRNGNLEMFSLPRFFRWIVPFFLSVMSTPRHERDIDALASAHIGIRHIITLTEETPLPEEWFFNKTISHTHLPVENYQPPTIEQVDIFFRLVNDPTKTPLLVHCGGGKGRAGTMIACYLAIYGFQAPSAQEWRQPFMSAAEAVEKLRQLRPGSIETDQQERFVHTYVSAVWKRQAALPPLPDEPDGLPLEIEGQLDGNIDLIMLCGVPGSGKSHVARMILTRDEQWTIISQDETGSRDTCERELGRPGKYSKVILDRCNPDRADRKEWLGIAQWAKKPICVYFDYNPELCVSRAQQRTDHPTLTPGQRVRTAVQSMHRQMERPKLNEGFVAICIVRSFYAADDLIRRLAPIRILKFLRTGHLVNLGAATADDFLVSFNQSNHTPHVIITEKVDGANMGFSLSADRELLVQNRSHYITSTAHAQFRPLYNWIETHREGLYHVLDRDNSFPERYILYGEWLVATHSIPYTRLPDRFLAFDLYDRQTQTWADRDTLERLLAETKISLVHIMYRGPRPTDAVLKEMVQRPSQFYDGPVEGIYVKEEQNGQVINRGKVVRSDFTAGITDHWDKAPMRKNGFLIGGDDIE